MPQTFTSFDEASVCGRRAGKVERRRRDGGNGVGAQRRRRAADGSPPLLRPMHMPLVTSARFAERNGRRREGDRDDGQPVERSKPRVGHGGSKIRMEQTPKSHSSQIKAILGWASCARLFVFVPNQPASGVSRAVIARFAWRGEPAA